MNAYRHDLAAAQSRIVHLERELLERDAAIERLRAPPPAMPAPTLVSAPMAEKASNGSMTRMRWWHAWPALACVGTAILYGAVVGAGMPRNLPELALAGGVVGSGLYSVVTVMRARAGGRSSVAQRLLTLLAGILAGPLALALGFLLMPFVGMAFGIGAIASGAYGACVALVEWIAGRSSSQ